MEFEDDIESLLRENESPQIAVDRIRSYFNCLHSPFKSKDMIHNNFTIFMNTYFMFYINNSS